LKTHIRRQFLKSETQQLPQMMREEQTLLPSMNIQTLTLKAYESICLEGNVPVLGAVIHSSAPNIKAKWPTVYSSLNALSEHCVEVIMSSSMPTYFNDGSLQIALTDTLLFGAIEEQCNQLEKRSYELYKQLIKQTRQNSMPHIYRMWNEIPNINLEENGIERYKQFCLGRSLAFADSSWENSALPAATAVGSTDKNLNVYFLSGNVNCQQIENPDQVSAFKYPPKYGKRSPSFARAQQIEIENKNHLLISGTASILGHKSLHRGDALKQTQQSLLNIQTLVSKATNNDIAFPQNDSTLSLKVYIRHEHDLNLIRSIVEQHTCNSIPKIYVQADICRSELLVEIEAQIGGST